MATVQHRGPHRSCGRAAGGAPAHGDAGCEALLQATPLTSSTPRATKKRTEVDEQLALARSRGVPGVPCVTCAAIANLAVQIAIIILQ